MRTVVFVLLNPVLDDCGVLSFRDHCYEQTIDICKELFDEIIIMARRRPLPATEIASSRLQDAGVRLVVEFPDFGAGGLRGVFSALKFLCSRKLGSEIESVLHHADIIHVEAPSLESYVVARKARKLKLKLTLETRGNVLLNQHYMRQRFGLLGVVYGKIFSYCFREIRRQALGGLYVNKSLEEQYPVAGGFHVTVSDVRLPDKLFSGPKKFTEPAHRFVYVGHLEQIKRVDLLLRALHAVSGLLPAQWTFAIIGDGPERPRLQSLAVELGIVSHVFFHGRIEWTRIFDYYRNADILLMASTSEGASRTMLEGMAAGLPVLSTAVGLASDLLDDRCLVNVGDVGEYVNKLKNLVNDPQLLTVLSEHNWHSAQDYRADALKSLRKSFFAKALELHESER